MKRSKGIQKNEESLGSDEKELLLQETIDGLNAKIFQIQSDHERELEMIMVSLRVVPSLLKIHETIKCRRKSKMLKYLKRNIFF